MCPLFFFFREYGEIKKTCIFRMLFGVLPWWKKRRSTEKIPLTKPDFWLKALGIYFGIQISSGNRIRRR